MVDTVENEYQNAILAAMDNLILTRIEVIAWSKIVLSEPDLEDVAANSEREEQTGITTCF